MSLSHAALVFPLEIPNILPLEWDDDDAPLFDLTDEMVARACRRTDSDLIDAEVVDTKKQLSYSPAENLQGRASVGSVCSTDSANLVIDIDETEFITHPSHTLPGAKLLPHHYDSHSSKVPLGSDESLLKTPSTPEYDRDARTSSLPNKDSEPEPRAAPTSHVCSGEGPRTAGADGGGRNESLSQQLPAPSPLSPLSPSMDTSPRHHTPEAPQVASGAVASGHQSLPKAGGGNGDVRGTALKDATAPSSDNAPPAQLSSHTASTTEPSSDWRADRARARAEMFKKHPRKDSCPEVEIHIGRKTIPPTVENVEETVGKPVSNGSDKYVPVSPRKDGPPLPVLASEETVSCDDAPTPTRTESQPFGEETANSYAQSPSVMHSNSFQKGAPQVPSPMPSSDGSPTGRKKRRSPFAKLLSKLPILSPTSRLRKSGVYSPSSQSRTPNKGLPFESTSAMSTPEPTRAATSAPAALVATSPIATSTTSAETVDCTNSWPPMSQGPLDTQPKLSPRSFLSSQREISFMEGESGSAGDRAQSPHTPSNRKEKKDKKKKKKRWSFGSSGTAAETSESDGDFSTGEMSSPGSPLTKKKKKRRSLSRLTSRLRKPKIFRGRESTPPPGT
eukprot:Rmarinus@m.26820